MQSKNNSSVNDINVSVIIPIYNTEKYLAKCLESVISQSLESLDIICIIDGSPDNSLAIAEHYSKKDSRVRIVNKKNEGVSAARNDGIELARGEYIFFLDSDDYIDAHFFEYFYENAKKNDSDVVILNSFWNLANRVNSKYFSALPTCSCFIKTKILKENIDIRYPKNIQPGEDGLFTHTLLTKCSKISSEDKVIYHYVKHEGQDHIKAEKNASFLVKAMESWCKYLDDYYTKNNLFERFSLSFAKYIEQECFLAFKTKNFSVDEEIKVFEIMKIELSKLTAYINKGDYQFFSKEFLFVLESSNIKEYYSKQKFRYNYIRFNLFGRRVSIRYKEYRLKYYKDLL